MSDFGKRACVAASAADVAAHITVNEAALSGVGKKGAPPGGGANGAGRMESGEELFGPMREAWHALVTPFLVGLDRHVDCRLVATLSLTLRCIVEHRHRNMGLLLSELGERLCGPAHGPAGTKRLSNLLRSPRWQAKEIGAYLWEQAAVRVRESGEDDLFLLWDESVIEKPESLESEGLCPVRSSKAGRLSRIKPGYYRPPSRPVFVPGLHWLAVLLVGRRGPGTVVAMRWWSTRCKESLTDSVTPVSAAPETSSPDPAGSPAVSEPITSVPTWLSTARQMQTQLLAECRATFGQRVVHVFDRGYAGGPWLEQLRAKQSRFIMRWPKRYQLQDENGVELATWRFLRGKRSWQHRMIHDARRRVERKTGVVAIRVYHPRYDEGRTPLWLIAARPGKNREPWYLLTNEPAATADQAFAVVFGYARRWLIETAFRFTKCEMAMESPRVWTWERRLKLLMMVTVVYALLLALLRLPNEWRQLLLDNWCHRTGKRSRETPTPLYRIRSALAKLFLAHPPDFCCYKSSG